MLTVHHLNNSRSQRVLWLLEELGVPYEVVRYQRDAKTMLAPPELKAVHPLGKSPVLTNGGLTLAETGAIVEHLLDAHGQGRLRPPAGAPEHVRFRYWLHYAEGSAMPLLLLRLVASRIISAPAPFFAKPITASVGKRLLATLVEPQLKTHLDFWERELGRTGWFAGDAFTAADIMMSFPAEAAAARLGLGGRAHIAEWLQKIRARPAYARALEKGGPYDLLT